MYVNTADEEAGPQYNVGRPSHGGYNTVMLVNVYVVLYFEGSD